MRRLSKSRWRLGFECPTKLFYTGKPEYPDSREHNEFLEALADGGMQVGAMAKLWWPHGVEVKTRIPEMALQETAKLLEGDSDVVIFEAAFAHENLFIRADVFMRFGGKYYLKEVKAKSWNNEEDSFFGKRGGLLSGWVPYLQDLAFQRYVITKALGQAPATYFMFVDKGAAAPCDGIYQSFVVKNKEVQVYDMPEEMLHNRLLVDVQADDALDALIADGFGGRTWLEQVEYCADLYSRDERADPVIGAHCVNCEFQTGFERCWKEHNVDLERPLVLHMKQFPAKKKLIADGVYYSDMVDPDKFSQDTELGVRQYNAWRGEPVLDRQAYLAEMENWTWPLNFIDFETCAPALPTHEGLKPYQSMAFQFSHHILHQDGRLEHRAFLHQDFDMPSYHFLRALKKSLEDNDGTVFRWHNHENTILGKISEQLNNDADNVWDAVELIAFAASLMKGGSREMVDQFKLASHYYYHPLMKGSWSIKKVLLSIFPEDPYKNLPPVHMDGLDLSDEMFSEATELHDGGAAMIAWLACQNPKMGQQERLNIFEALLRYCELDTKAMVWFHQHMVGDALSD